MSDNDPFGRRTKPDAGKSLSGDYTRLASLWERAVAMIIDTLISFVLIFVATFLIIAVEDGEEPNDSIMTAIFLVVPWLYYALLEGGPMGATLGKRALGLVVTDRFGDRIDVLKASLRYFSKIVIPLTGFLGYFMILFVPKKQAIHDIMVGTLVYKR